jgi:hypothetical protein
LIDFGVPVLQKERQLFSDQLQRGGEGVPLLSSGHQQRFETVVAAFSGHQ